MTRMSSYLCAGIYLTVREAAERLGVDTSRIYQFIEDGRLEVVRAVPRATLVRERALKKLKRLPTGRPPKKRPARARTRRTKK